MNRAHYPAVYYEQYLIGELPEALSRELEQSEGFAERIAAIEASNAEILEQYDPAAFATRIRNRYEAAAHIGAGAELAGSARASAVRGWFSPGQRLRSFGLALSAVAAVAVVAVASFGVFGGLGVAPVDPTLDAVRLKGADQSISVYRARLSSVERLADQSTAAVGDRLQLAYTVSESRYGMVVSVDGLGNVTVHLPESGSASTRLSAGGEQVLSRAFVLDDAPRFEHFLLITSSEPFDAASVVERVKSAADGLATSPPGSSAPSGLPAQPVFPENFTVTSFTVAKDE